MYIPLPETAERISGFSDVLKSQWSHYLTGNGRLLAHMLVQFFLWQGKNLFNIVNSIVFVLLLLEIYWISDKGKVSFKYLKAGTLSGIFFSLWAFTVNFSGVFLWVSGACNYLWMTVLLLSFILLYIRKYYQINEAITHASYGKYLIFFWGVLAGWTNENTVCWIIIILGLWLFKNRKEPGIEAWMWYGLAGLCTGYVLLVFAPGNIVRAGSYTKEAVNVWSWQYMRSKLITFGVIEFFEIFLWFFIITSWRKIRNLITDDVVSRKLTLIKICCALNLLCNGTMLLAPEFPARSGFFSLVFLTIAAALVNSIQSDVNIPLIDDYATKFLLAVAGCYFVVTLGATYIGMISTNKYDKNVVKLINQYKTTGSASIMDIPAPPVHPEVLLSASGRHLVRLELTENENDWTNVAYARYYGIKGIRVKR